MASRTTAPPGTGCRIDPAIAARKIPVRRHPSGFTAAGRGTTKTTIR